LAAPENYEVLDAEASAVLMVFEDLFLVTESSKALYRSAGSFIYHWLSADLREALDCSFFNSKMRFDWACLPGEARCKFTGGTVMSWGCSIME